MAMAGSDDERQTHEKFAKEANGRAWSLLGKGERSAGEDEAMVDAAHAAMYHWSFAGTVVNAQRGEWLLARVYTILGHDERAMHYALRCMDLTLQHPGEMEDFDRAYAEEGLARAYALMGDEEQARLHRKAAAEAGAKISDEEDRRIFTGDLQGEPWFGLTATPT